MAEGARHSDVRGAGAAAQLFVAVPGDSGQAGRDFLWRLSSHASLAGLKTDGDVSVHDPDAFSPEGCRAEGGTCVPPEQERPSEDPPGAPSGVPQDGGGRCGFSGWENLSHGEDGFPCELDVLVEGTVAQAGALLDAMASDGFSPKLEVGAVSLYFEGASSPYLPDGDDDEEPEDVPVEYDNPAVDAILERHGEEGSGALLDIGPHLGRPRGT